MGTKPPKEREEPSEVDEAAEGTLDLEAALRSARAAYCSRTKKW